MKNRPISSALRLATTVLAACVLAPLSSAQLSNQDSCAGSGLDIVGPGTHTFDLSGATTGTQGQNEASCYAFGTSQIASDIWATYVAATTGTALVSTCNSTGTLADSKLAVYPGGTACPVGGTSIACSDDQCGMLSSVSFPVTAGQSYVLQVGLGPGAAAGDGSLEVTELPAAQTFAEDDCANASADTVGPGTYDFDNAGATTGPQGQSESICYAFGLSGIQNDVWAVYVAAVDGSVTIDTCGAVGSNLDTKIAAYPNAACGSIDGTAVACNDDTCSLRSSITFDVSSGGSYLLQLGSFPGSGDGTAQVAITETPNGPGPIGFAPGACNPANANSTGSSATIRAEGEAAASAMDVDVIAEGLPPGQFGYFFASQTLGFIANPGGSAGNICVVGNPGRYNDPGQIGQGPTLMLEVGSINVPTNPVPGQMILAGETWYWQCWYRDLSGTTSNFTNVVGVAFL